MLERARIPGLEKIDGVERAVENAIETLGSKPLCSTTLSSVHVENLSIIYF